MTNRIAFFAACLAFAGWAAAAEDTIVIDKSVFVGGNVRIAEPVEGTAHAAGGRIELDAPVSGSAHLAGGEIVVKGAITGNLRAAGGRITIDGPIGGDAWVAGGALDLGPNARIAGSLRFHGGELNRDPAAQVMGAVEHESGRRHRPDSGPWHRYSSGWAWTPGLMVLAAIIAAALPGPARRMTSELREHPWMAPLIGFIALTGIPIAALIVMITIIGIPIGLLALLGYFALLLVGYVSLSVVVAGLLLDRYQPRHAADLAWRAVAAMSAVLALGIVIRLPFVGGWIGFIALMVGVGMVVGAAFRRQPAPLPGGA